MKRTILQQIQNNMTTHKIIHNKMNIKKMVMSMIIITMTNTAIMKILTTLENIMRIQMILLITHMMILLNKKVLVIILLTLRRVLIIVNIILIMISQLKIPALYSNR